ncbi:MAG TPA: HAMP domain-containing sensor histidine kinase [Acidobacteriaceae bacterium]
MRTKLLFALLSVSFGLTAAILFIIRTNLEHQIRERLLGDLISSVNTFHNLEDHRKQALLHDTALLADLPTLKALMTSADRRTIRDAGTEFWRVSGNDLLALANPDEEAIAVYTEGPPLDEEAAAKALQHAIGRTPDPQYLAVDGRLYEVSIKPLYFGPVVSGTRLGFVISGYEINHQVAQEVKQAATAEVAFCMDGRIVASTLDETRKRNLSAAVPRLAQATVEGEDIWLGQEHFLAASVPLSENASPRVQLLVLKSYDQASLFVRKLNRLIIVLGLFVLVAGGLLALYIAKTITRPLESLASGAIAFGSGDFSHELRHDGGREIRDLSLAFDRMRLQLRQTQQELLEAERLATIGRMASSISHDLRHHLSAVYANAEFLGYSSADDKDRTELLGEIRMAVQEMTELIDSLLMFSRTGKALHLSSESLAVVVERAVSLVRAHPDGGKVRIQVNTSGQAELWIDAKKLERATYNLLLNACQAAARSTHHPLVSISVTEDDASARIRIQDNGPGVSDSIRLTLFEPFVSEGKQNGIGLGLTLAHRIAQEHGGSVTLEESGPSGSVFVLSIAKTLGHSPNENQSGTSMTTQASAESTSWPVQTVSRRGMP